MLIEPVLIWRYCFRNIFNERGHFIEQSIEPSFEHSHLLEMLEASNQCDSNVDQ